MLLLKIASDKSKPGDVLSHLDNQRWRDNNEERKTWISRMKNGILVDLKVESSWESSWDGTLCVNETVVELTTDWRKIALPYVLCVSRLKEKTQQRGELRKEDPQDFPFHERMFLEWMQSRVLPFLIPRHFSPSKHCFPKTILTKSPVRIRYSLTFSYTRDAETMLRHQSFSSSDVRHSICEKRRKIRWFNDSRLVSTSASLPYSLPYSLPRNWVLSFHLQEVSRMFPSRLSILQTSSDFLLHRILLKRCFKNRYPRCLSNDLPFSLMRST